MCFVPPEHPLLSVVGQLNLSDKAREELVSRFPPPRLHEHSIQHIVRNVMVTADPPPTGHTDFALSIYTMHNKTTKASDPAKKLQAPGDKLMDTHGFKPSGVDDARDMCYENIHMVWNFYNEVFERKSIDGNGMEIRASIHVGEDSGDAFWSTDDQQMFFGDGGKYDDKGKTTNKLTPFALDVIGHELTHGIISKTVGLMLASDGGGKPPVYPTTWTPELTKAIERFPPEEQVSIRSLGPLGFALLLDSSDWARGTLDEHIADCFGIMAKQWHLKQTAEHADWNVAPGWWSPKTMQTQGWDDHNYLRTFLIPDSKVKQPDTGPKIWRETLDMWYAVDMHRYAGIGNHAFYQAALKFGGESWKSVGQIWYNALTDETFKQRKNQTYQGWRDLTIVHAKKLFDEAGAQKMTDAWKVVNL